MPENRNDALRQGIASGFYGDVHIPGTHPYDTALPFADGVQSSDP